MGASRLPSEDQDTQGKQVVDPFEVPFNAPFEAQSKEESGVNRSRVRITRHSIPHPFVKKEIGRCVVRSKSLVKT